MVWKKRKIITCKDTRIKSKNCIFLGNVAKDKVINVSLTENLLDDVACYMFYVLLIFSVYDIK